MLVVHGFWAPGTGLGLWAEDSDRPVTSRSEAVRSARPHPFAAPAQDLLDLHTDHLVDVPHTLLPPEPGASGTAVVRLPSLRRAPLDSPELVRVRGRRPSRSTPALLDWTVPIVAYGAMEASLVLAERFLGARPGASFTYLTELAAFAEDLVAGGKALPTVRRDGSGAADGMATACWRPVLQGPDVAALSALTRAMPPVCRAQPGHDDPHELVTDMLAALVDGLVRRDLRERGTGLVPPRRGRRPKQLPVAEAWLAALAGPDGKMAAGHDAVRQLSAALAPWDAHGTGKTGPAHATFRLTELPPAGALPDATATGDDPTPGDDPMTDPDDTTWQLEYLLQSRDDPSLLVPAGQIWSDDGSLGRWLADPQELLLGELGRASTIYPALATGLRQARPASIQLDADGAYDFLTSGAPALADAGFGVLLPNWWGEQAGLGLKLKATGATPVDGVVTRQNRFGKDQILRFNWQLAVGDHSLTDEEIAVLAATKAPLVRLRGQWVAVDRDQLERGLRFLQRNNPKGNSRKRKTAGELLALASSHPDDLDTPLPVAAVEADGWLGDLLNGDAPQTLQALPTPHGLKAELRPYQERGLAWLAFLSSLGFGACLADDMGLGKTVQLLALECSHRADTRDVGPTLLLCPMSLVGNWQREAARFAPDLQVYAHHGPQRLRGDALAEQLQATDIVVTTYTTATRDIEELERIEWERVVLDEAQAIKNALSQAAKATKRLSANHRVALTGTPVENRLAELWSIMDFLNPGLLGSSELFRTRYAIPVERHGLTEPAGRLRDITRPYILRRLKTDPTIIDDLPDKIEVKEYCQLTPEQASLYQSVVDDMLNKIENTDGIERRGNVLAAMAKLKQVCNHPALLLHDRSALPDRSGKLARIEELLEEILAEGDSVLCFTQFTQFAEMLLPHLATRFGRDIAYLHGGTSRKRRDELVSAFQSEDGPPIFLLSLKAGGTGLNLTAANQVIHLDRWWNPAVENQATDRAFRIGQERNVQVRKLICTGTLEEHIDDMIEEKKALADLVVRDGEGWLTELSTQDLRRVLSLSEGAVGES